MAPAQTSNGRYNLFEGNEPPLTNDDIVVVVMGATGTGKSTFISTVTGKKTIKIGHHLNSETIEVQLYTCYLPNITKRYVLVDTVGFDDTTKSDAEVLGTIADWLAATYNSKIVPAGLLFLHKITDNWFSKSSTRNLQIFRSLCGEDCLKNVVLVTTMWGNLADEQIGSQREAELESNIRYWRPLVRRGAQVRRFQDTKQSGYDILSLFVDRARIPFQIQREMVDVGFELLHTSAGAIVDEDLARKDRQHKHALSNLKKEKKEKAKRNDVSGVELVKEEVQMHSEQVEQTKKKRKHLKGNFWRGIGDAILRAFSFQLRQPSPA